MKIRSVNLSLLLGLIALAATVAAGCSTNASLEEFPQIQVTLNGQNKSSWEFSPDTTGGQLTQEIKVLIRNSGKGVLTIKTLDWLSQNPFMKVKYSGGKPTLPLSLANNASYGFSVVFAPDPNVENNKSAKLTVGHNDLDKKAVNIFFSIRAQGAKISLDTTQYVFVNASKANPPTACFKFGNTGNAKLAFLKSYFSTSNPLYTIVETPNQGDEIGALGEPDNPKNNPKKLQVCVRLTPASKDADYGTTVTIETTDKSNPKAKIALDAKWEENNVFKVSCADPSGSLLYNFQGVLGGSKQQTCNIYNEGPSGFLINKIELKALNPSQQSVVDGTYEVTLYKKSSTGDKTETSTPFSINAGKSLDFEVTFNYPGDGKVADAEMVIRYSQANMPNAVQIPVLVGKCDTPNLLVGPGLAPLWLQAKLTAKNTGSVILANQSCAPLKIVTACATKTSGGASLTNVCDSQLLASSHFKLAQDLALKSIDPWALQPVVIDFEPPDEKYTDVNHYLNVIYCSGLWKDGKCDGGFLVKQVINLTGYVGEGVTRPSLKLAPFGDSEAKVGQPYMVEAAATAGSYPIGQYGAYLWFVSKRPSSSKLWLNTEFQTTNEPTLTVNPDLPGDYEIIGVVQSVDANDSAKLAWSEQVVHAFYGR